MLEALERLGLEDFEDELSGVDLLALARDGRLAELKKPKGPLSKADATRATKQLKQLMSEGVLWRCWTDGRRGERDHFAAYTAENSAILEAAFQPACDILTNLRGNRTTPLGELFEHLLVPSEFHKVVVTRF